MSPNFVFNDFYNDFNSQKVPVLCIFCLYMAVVLWPAHITRIELVIHRTSEPSNLWYRMDRTRVTSELCYRTHRTRVTSDLWYVGLAWCTPIVALYIRNHMIAFSLISVHCVRLHSQKCYISILIHISCTSSWIFKRITWICGLSYLEFIHAH